MNYVSENNKDPIYKTKGANINIKNSTSNQIPKDKKIFSQKKTEKTYTITVTYIQLTVEEAKIKRAIIESILKKGFGK